MVFITSQSEKLFVRIMEKKKELEQLVCLNGLASRKVLRCSQELDGLIYQIQLLNREILMEDFYQYQDSKGNY